MKKFLIAVGLTAGLLSPHVSWAQDSPRSGPGGGWSQGREGGPGRGGRGMRRGAKMRLPRQIESMSELKGAQQLSKAQAKRLVLLVRPWQSRPSMTETQAQSLSKQIAAVLTPAQKAELQKMRRDRGGRGGWGGREGGREGGPRGEAQPGGGRPGGGRPGGGRPGGGRPGGPGGGRPRGNMRETMQKMEGFFQTFNPFYAPSKYSQLRLVPERMRKGWTRRHQEFTQTMASLSRRAS
jgi:hypothetical protein